MQAGLLPPCKGGPDPFLGEVLTQHVSAAATEPIGHVSEQRLHSRRARDTMTRGCERLEPRPLIVPTKAWRGQLPLVLSQTRERVPHSSMQNTAQCKAIHYYLLYLLIHPSPGTRLV
jgi:hypothetical protein